MKKYLLIFFLFFISMQIKADEEKPVEEKKEVVIDMDKVSETLGHLLIKQLNNPAFSFNIDKIVEGMKGASLGKTAPLTEAEYEEQILAIQEKIYHKTSEKNLSDAVSFLDQNQKEQGVVSLSDKLQYKIIQEGNENISITNEMKPVIHYIGKLLDGTVFASSHESKNPITISMKETISGFSQGLLGMKKGEKRILYIHPELAYGMASHLPPNSMLVFEVEVLETNAVSQDDSENKDESDKEGHAALSPQEENAIADASTHKDCHHAKKKS